MVKASRCSVDPDWRFAISSKAAGLPKSVKDAVIRAAYNFLAIANSYQYEDDDGSSFYEVDPVWEYIHPRPNCNHIQSDYDCEPKHIVVPADANELVDYIEGGQLVITWMRHDCGPVHDADGDCISFEHS